MRLEPMFPPQEQTIVSFNKPFIAHLRARQHKPFIHIGKGAIGFTHPPQTPNVVHYAFVDNSSIELARHLARHDRDLILFAIPDNMNVNEMRNKIGCIGFNPNVSTCTDRFNDAIIAQIDKDFVTYVLDIDKIVNHKPITHKPHKYGKGDWLSKRKR